MYDSNNMYKSNELYETSSVKTNYTSNVQGNYFRKQRCQRRCNDNCDGFRCG